MKIEMRLFHGPSDWGWVTEQLPLLRVQDTCGLMAIDTETNETVAACIFDNFLNNSAQASIILSTPMVLKYGFLEECFDFIFDGCGKDWLYVFAHEKNEKALRLNKHLGFVEKMRIHDGYQDGVDFIVMEMHKDNCAIFNKSLSEVA